MKCLALIVGLSIFSIALPASAEKINQLSRSEKMAGWKLLFDGKSLADWRSYKKADGPKQGWVIEDGCLKLEPKSGGGDIVTRETFLDYELRWEWRIAAKSNNGLKYLVSEDRSAPGPEYQMIDDAIQEPLNRRTASFYDVLAPTILKPTLVGEWNKSRLIIQGNHVEHWLNDDKVLTYEIGSPEHKSALAQSKFKEMKGFGEKIKGHILLTDHNDAVWYRNIMIREFASSQGFSQK